MRPLWIIVALLSWAGAMAQAQQLPVRSGAHPTFSRITLPVPTTQSWEAQRTRQGVEVTLPGHAGGFDIADVFLRMPRNRITDITTESSKLTLQVRCACTATAFRSGELLVIDIVDEGAAMAGPPLEDPSTIEIKRPLIGGRNTSGSTVALPWIGSDSPFDTSPASRSAVTRKTGAESPDTRIKDRVALLDEIQQSLIERVADAASSGLLENSYEEPPAQPQLAVTSDTPATIEPVELPEIVRSTSQNLRITTSMDLPERPISPSLDAATSGIACPSEGAFALEIWGNDDSFSAQMGPARNALMNARDQLNLDAAKRLAQLYLYFGFGAEALETLRLDPALGQSNPYLAEIASIFEYGAVTGPGNLGAFTDCASEISLWATLSFQEVPQGILIDTNAALRALNRLPKHLRQIVAPALSGRLLKYGDTEAAATAMRSIERLPDPLAPEAIMAQAGLAIDAGKPAAAFLEDVIETNSSESPAALVKLVEGKLANDEPLSYETATLIEAYAQELRGTEMGNQLRRTQILALSQSEHFEEAFSALDALSPSLAPQVAMQLRQSTLERLAQKAEDIVFLEHLFAQDAAAMDGLPKTTKLILATRLMDLGFAAQVQEMLETVSDRPRSSARQLLAARASLALQQPFQAQAALIGIDDPKAQLLMAQAKEMSGAYREAAEIFSETDAPEQAVRAAWLSDDWRDLTSAETPGFGAVASLAQAEAEEADPDLGPLGRANQILEESSMARDTLEQFLRDPLVQITPDS